jgi:N-acetylmuramoyl-L-alanine amidase
MKKVFIAAGHDFIRTGVSGKTTSGAVVREERYATQMRDAIAAKLQHRGIPFATDGEPGENGKLGDAIKWANRPDITGLKVDIHLNGAKNPTATGIEVLADDDHRAVAQSLAAVVASVTGFRLRGDRGYREKDSGHHARLGFIENADGLILELGFVSNPADADVLVAKFDEIAAALADWFEAQARGDNAVSNREASRVTPIAQRPVVAPPPVQPPSTAQPIPASDVRPSRWREWATGIGGGATGIAVWFRETTMNAGAWVVTHRVELLLACVLMAVGVMAWNVWKLRKEVAR